MRWTNRLLAQLRAIPDLRLETRGAPAGIRQVPDLTHDTKGAPVDVKYKGTTLATLRGDRLDMAVPAPYVPILLGKVANARMTTNGLAVDIDGSSAVDAATSLVRMRIDEERFGGQFSEHGP